MAASDEQTRQFILDNFPSYAWVMQIPDLAKVFSDAIGPTGKLAEGSGNIISKLEATDWWKGHGQSTRQYLANQYTDPETLAESIRNKNAEVHQIANKMGLSDSQLDIDGISRRALQLGWDGPQLQEQLAALAQYAPGQAQGDHIGTIDNAIAQISELAANYMVTVDDQTKFQWARDVAAGHHEVADYATTLADWSKGKFPTLASVIDSGMLPKNYFDPLKQEVGRLLERNPDDIDLMNDPKFTRIISYTDPKTNAPRPMTFAETQAYVRSTDDWWRTKQAKQVGADMVEGLAQTFGKVSTGQNSLLAGPANTF